MRMATLAQLIAAEDLADAAADEAAGQPFGAPLVDTDLDAIDEVLVTSPGSDRDRGSRRGRRHLVVGSASQPRGAGVRAAAAARGIPRAPPHTTGPPRCEATRGDGGAASGGTGAGAAVTRRGRGRRPRRSTTSSRQGARPRRAPALRPPRAARAAWFTCSPADGPRPRRSSRPATGSWATSPKASYELGRPWRTDRLAARRRSGRRPASIDAVARPLAVARRYRFGGDRIEPDLELDDGGREPPATAPVAFELAVEWNLNLLGGGHNPAAWYETRRRRTSELPTTSPARWTRVRPIAFGNDYEGVRVVARREPAARLTWYPVETVSNSEAGFERVYQGSCAALPLAGVAGPGERATPASVRWRHRPVGRAVLDREAQAADRSHLETRGRGPQSSAPRPRPATAARLRYHRRVSRPNWPSTATSISPSAATRSPGRSRLSRPQRRTATGTPGSTPSATSPTPSAAISATSPTTSAPLWPAGWRTTTLDPQGLRGFGPVAGDGRARLRQRHGPGIPPRHPAARLAGGPPDRDPLGPARLRAALRAAADRHLAARNRRRHADAPHPRRRGRSATRSWPRGRPPTHAWTRAARTAWSWAAARRSSSSSTMPRCQPRPRSSRTRPWTPTHSPASGSLPRIAGPAFPDGTPRMAVIATDGELYGHHQKFRDLFLARLVNPGPDAPDRGFDVTTVGQVVGACRPALFPPLRSPSGPRGAATTAFCAGRRVPGRVRRPLEGTAARRPGAARVGNRHRRRRARGDFMEPDGFWQARDEYVDVVFGVGNGRGLRPALSAPGRRRAAGRLPAADGSRTLAPGHVRQRRLVLGRPRPARRPSRSCCARPGPCA